MSKRVIKIVSNYNYYSTNNTHTLLREPSFCRYNESDNKQFMEMNITKSLNINNDYLTDGNLQKANKSKTLIFILIPLFKQSYSRRF